MPETRPRLDRRADRERRRAPWRQKLVDAERGITLGFRSDSTLFVHLFVACLILAGGLVVGLSAMQWTCLTLALTVVLTAEMFQQGLKALALDESGATPPPAVSKALRMATAAVMVAVVGLLTTVALLFASRLDLLLDR